MASLPAQLAQRPRLRSLTLRLTSDELDDRYDPSVRGGLASVGVERRKDAVGERPESRPISAVDHDGGPHGDPAEDDVGVSTQVVEPRWVARGTRVRCSDDNPVGVVEVDDRMAPRRTGESTGGLEECCGEHESRCQAPAAQLQQDRIEFPADVAGDEPGHSRPGDSGVVTHDETRRTARIDVSEGVVHLGASACLVGNRTITVTSMAHAPPTRQRLLDEGMRLFAAHGFHATTVGDIETASGLQPRRGALYKHFTSKKSLLEAAVRSRLDRAATGADDIAAVDLTLLAGSDRDVARVLVEGLGRWFLDEMDDMRDLTRVMEHDGERMADITSEVKRDIVDLSYRTAATLIASVAPRASDPDAVAVVLLGSLVALRRTMWTFGSAPVGLDDVRALDAWTELALRGSVHISPRIPEPAGWSALVSQVGGASG